MVSRVSKVLQSYVGVNGQSAAEVVANLWLEISQMLRAGVSYWMHSCSFHAVFYSRPKVIYNRQETIKSNYVLV